MTAQEEIDAAEEERRRFEHAIMNAAGLTSCPNIAHREYVHLETCDAIAAVTASEQQRIIERCAKEVGPDKMTVPTWWEPARYFAARIRALATTPAPEPGDRKE